MQNPFTEIRRERGMSIREAAAWVGVPLQTWKFTELGGVAYPRKMLVALQAHGYDPEELMKKYEAWRQEQAAQLQAKSASSTPAAEASSLREENPFRRIRCERGMSLNEVARWTGSSATTWWRAEEGSYACPARLLLALARHGYDPHQLLEEYRTWRKKARAGDARKR